MTDRIKRLDLLELDLDWKLATQRLSRDMRDDFWPDPLRFRDFLGFSEDITRLEPLLKCFSPYKGASYPIPKPSFTVRDSIYLTAFDRLVYQALVDRLIPHMDPLLSDGVFSYRYRKPDGKWMFIRWQDQTRKFDETVKNALHDTPGGFLVTTDIARYFEAISFRVLRTQLDNLANEAGQKSLKPCIDALITCVKGWSPHDGHGLVQNVEASSFIGNVLLDCVDKLMTKEGYLMFRYMDDIRIVVRSEAEARTSLMRLIHHLRALGLGVNTQKTHIIQADSPELLSHLPNADVELGVIEQAVATKRLLPVKNIVGLLFEKAAHLIECGLAGTNAFKFCLNRITTLRAYRGLELPPGNEITDTVLRLLIAQPDETVTFCKYLEVAPLQSHHCLNLQRLLVAEPLCVYSWQNFHLWRLASQRRIQSKELTRKAHKLMAGDSTNPEVAGAALYLGERGDYADRQAIAKLLPSAPKGLIARCYQVAIQELHRAERNTIFRELAGSDGQTAMLTEHLEGLHEPLYFTDPPRIELDELADAILPVYS